MQESDDVTIFRSVMTAAIVLPLCAAGAPSEQNDLREFRVGMPVSALPESGYGSFTCADDAAQNLKDWRDYKLCPATREAFHAVSFRYDSGANNGQTVVGGQPVNLALLIDDSAQVAGLRIETDPHVSLYQHKKAHLFALQVKARFGEEGWTCQKAEPTATEQPVGGVFVHEHCEKVTESRRFLLNRQLFRDPSKNLREFTDATQLTILKAG
jgi:hypothetical protein